MKKGLVFFLGMITGAILLFLVALFYMFGSSNKEEEKDNISMFSNPGETLNLKSFEIMQVLPNGSALAHSSEKAKSQYTYYGNPIVLFLPVDGSSYYDNQIIEVPAKKVVRQVGSYKYKSGAGLDKTVPIVKFFDK